MKVGLNSIANYSNAGKINFSSSPDDQYLFVLAQLPSDTFEKSTGYTDISEDIEILAGPLGHPHTGRPVALGSEAAKAYEENMSFMEWILNPERKLYKRPKTFIENLFSLGDNNFNDDVAKYHSELAMENAKKLIGKAGDVAISMGDINGDGVADTIISGINKAIDIDGDGVADVIGTLIDVTGDGKADFVLDKLGNMIELKGEVASVIGDSGIELSDLAYIPEIIKTLLGG